MRNPSGNNNRQLPLLFAGVFATVLTAGFLWYAFRSGTLFQSSSTANLHLRGKADDDEETTEEERFASVDANFAEPEGGKAKSTEAATPLTSNLDPELIARKKADADAASSLLPAASETVSPSKSEADAKRKETNRLVEDADRRGKALFKKKRYLEAATCFTEALDLLSPPTPTPSTSTPASTAADASASADVDVDPDASASAPPPPPPPPQPPQPQPQLSRQAVTLMNNRSAMYEKAGLAELALADCDAVLEADVGHERARTRKMRVLESERRWGEALVEVCALQLRFMRNNRDKLRMGIPVKPPVPQDKIEELMGHILPEEVEATLRRVKDVPRKFPSDYTILQLLKSFSGYNAWMSAAAKDGNSTALTAELDAIDADDADAKRRRAELLLRRGRRLMYDRRFEVAAKDFEAAYDIVANNESVVETFDQYPRLLEWVGMCRHLRYDLDGATKCYVKCSDLEPTNAEILVKRAGVKMDAGKVDESLELFETALGLEPDAVDALLHRSNLRMLQQKGEEAKTDLERCIELRPNFVLARLRLATLQMANNDLEAAKKCLDAAESIEPESSEVQSYRGEMHFAQGEFAEAKHKFDRAIECEPNNPTPYVNAALAVMNTPTIAGPPDVKEAIDLLTKAIEVDPMFHAAYVHLGQLKLSMATNLSEAREVVVLYDEGIKQCRTAEELKDICSMRILTVAQVDAASALKMETLNMQ